MFPFSIIKRVLNSLYIDDSLQDVNTLDACDFRTLLTCRAVFFDFNQPNI